MNGIVLAAINPMELAPAAILIAVFVVGGLAVAWVRKSFGNKGNQGGQS